MSDVSTKTSTVSSEEWVMPAPDEPWVYPSWDVWMDMTEDEADACYTEAVRRGVDLSFFNLPAVTYFCSADGRIFRIDRNHRDDPRRLRVQVYGSYEEDPRDRHSMAFEDVWRQISQNDGTSH